jgi:hypothetical protein
MGISLTHLWGARFSAVSSMSMASWSPWCGLFNRVGLNAGPALPPSSVQPEVLQARVAALMAPE